MNKNSYKLSSLEDSKNFITELVEFIKSKKRDKLSLFFYAPMGAGKTTMIRELGQQLGIEESITSPTFVGMNQYQLDDLSFYHFDLYQVALNYQELCDDLDQGQNILVFEWSEKLDQQSFDLLKRDTSIISIRIKLEGDKRVLSIDHDIN